MDVIIPKLNLVRVLFDPAIPTSSTLILFNYFFILVIIIVLFYIVILNQAIMARGFQGNSCRIDILNNNY